MARKKLSFESNPLFSGPSLVDRAQSGSPYRELSIGDIDVDPDQPRRVFDTQSLSDLAASIKQQGVLCPILVRPTDAGTYKLISGERRLRASKIAGLEKIPAIIDNGEDLDRTILAKQLVENIQRDDLTSMEKALAFGQLRDAYGWSVREIAKQLGVSKSQVQRSIDVLMLPDDLQSALIEGASESKILLLSRIQDREMRKELLLRLADLSRSQLEDEIAAIEDGLQGNSRRSSHGGTVATKTREKIRPEDRRIVEDMQQALGIRVNLLRRKGKETQGKLILEFYSSSDLNELYRRLASSSTALTSQKH
ncbi:MAG: ParB/RepB/Spo0J family partition protein [Deltaproteobacteria bacterium]|nr:ParB/RepB/Spo0J family partition protein [Deltaproteobacteria bacterium]